MTLLGASEEMEKWWRNGTVKVSGPNKAAAPDRGRHPGLRSIMLLEAASAGELWH
jgi:hypothetical protein